MIVQELTRAECIAVLGAQRIGRLACVSGSQPYVVPIHYAFASNYLYSFSAPGQKIDWMRENACVCIQVDEGGIDRQWRSVVVYGLYEELPDTPQWHRDRLHAWSLLQKHANWWEPASLKPESKSVATTSADLFYRIKVESMTGRRATTAD